jgi:ABC-type multidrug transport system fused ATPase/permease subunit
MLIIFGFLLESSISKKKFFIFYIASGIIIGLISFFLSPYTPIIGASGVAFALFGAAMICRPVKSLLALFILSSFLIPHLIDPFVTSIIHKKEKELTQTTQKITQKIQESQKRLEELKHEYTTGNVSKEVYESITRDIQSQIKKFNESVKKISKEKIKIEETKRISITFPVAEHLHIVGMWVGICLLLILEPDKIKRWNKFIIWFLKRVKK